MINALYFSEIGLSANASLPVDTTAIDVALLGQLDRHGFGLGQPCIGIFTPVGPVP